MGTFVKFSGEPIPMSIDANTTIATFVRISGNDYFVLLMFLLWYKNLRQIEAKELS
ncbi:hypothetical protein Hdeb2414_s0025g00664261 [Helianthus debilis subsp. tardiflorus]